MSEVDERVVGAGTAALDDEAAEVRFEDIGLEIIDAAPSEADDSGREATLEQLAAVGAVLNHERLATEHDIVIQAALEPLRDGPKSESWLVAHLDGIWPGTAINSARLAAAMGVARQADLAYRSSRNGQVEWALTPKAAAEVGRMRDWARDILEATARQVREQLAAAGRDVTESEALLWTGRLKHALLVAVRGSFAAYNGDVIHNGDSLLAVRHYDLPALRKTVLETAGNESDAELLLSLAMNAVNPVTDFGNDLVTTITVGYMLHAFIGRLDHLHDRAAIGSLKGEYALLDTTVLPMLLGAPEQAQSLHRAITAAIEAEMIVIVPEHYLAELQELVNGIYGDNRDLIRQVETDKVKPLDLSAVIDNEILSLWLRGLAAGTYRNFAEFRAATARLGGTLRTYGVRVEPHGNKTSDNARRFITPLAAEVGKRHRIRTNAALARDAEAMAMACRLRRSGGASTFWPSAWIVTVDSCMGPAYKAVYPADAFPLTLTPASWLSILCNCSSPATAPDLAKAASKLLAEDAFMNVAARFTPRTAAEIARALSPEAGGSVLDLHVAQLSLDQILRNQPDFDQDSNALGARIAAEVIRKRGERQNASFEQARERDKTAMHRGEGNFTRRLQEEIASRKAAEQLLEDERTKVLLAAEATKKERVLGRRRSVLVGGLVGLVAALVALAYFRIWPGVALAAVSWLVLAYQGRRWITDTEASWRELVIGSAVGVLGIASGFVRWPWL
jgi:hypothetical protein